jgi:hypothetical protein
MRRAVAARSLAIVALVVVLASCQPRPAGTVALSLYHRNLGDQPFSYRVLGTPPESEAWIGLVPGVVSSAGCGFVSPDWELIVTQGEEPPDPADDIAARAGADDYEARDPIAIALSVEADGSIEITEGVPAWWDSDIQRCP